MEILSVDIIDHYRTDDDIPTPGVAAQFTFRDADTVRTGAAMFTPILHEHNDLAIIGVVPGGTYVRVLDNKGSADLDSLTDTELLFAAALPKIAAASLEARVCKLQYRIDLYERAAGRGRASEATLAVWQQGIEEAAAEILVLCGVVPELVR